MAETYVLHWHDRHNADQVLAETGPGARERIVSAILTGQAAGPIDLIVRYDPEEHIADNVSEEIALELERCIANGEPENDQARDLIETQCGA